MKPFASWKQAAIVIGIALPLLAGAATATPGSAPDAAAPGVGSAELPQSDYRLGGGDTIRITVFQIPDLTLETRVGESGEMSYPNIGKVKVGGLTLGDAADEIAKQLDRHEIAKHPQVSITLLQVRGNQVSVLGQVNRPGRIPLETTSMRLSDVLAAAGGVINAANAATVDGAGGDKAVISGVRDDKPFHRVVDLPSLLTGTEPDDDIIVANGDTVYVPPAPIYYIYGEVQRPGAYRIKSGMTVRQALALAGGPTNRGTERGIHVERPDGSDEARELTPAMNDPIHANDVLHVPESLF